MKNRITISALARLMGVSTHQIWYFEDKEVLFRKLGLSVQTLKESIDGSSPAYRIQQRNAKELKCWFHTDARRGMNAMLLAKQAPPPDLFESDIYFVIEDNGKIAVCRELKTEGDLMLPDSAISAILFLRRMRLRSSCGFRERCNTRNCSPLC